MSPPDNPGRDRRHGERDEPIGMHERTMLPVPSDEDEAIIISDADMIALAQDSPPPRG